MGSTLSSVVFQPPVVPSYDATKPPFDIRIPTGRDGETIPAFYITQRTATYVVIFSHGNAEDIGMIYDWLNHVSQRCNINILAYEYTGYYQRRNNISESSIYNDINAAYRYTRRILLVKNRHIILYGRSLGSCPTIRLGSKHSDIAGVILQSPLLSIYRVAFPFRFSLIGDFFCNIDLVSTLNVPTTIIHGTSDEIVPFWHGEELFNALNITYRRKPLWIKSGGHNNLEAMLEGRFINHLMEFIRNLN